MITRRAVIWAGAGMATWTGLNASGIEFWERKAPSEWTSEEIDRLITKSPWSKEVTADYAAQSSGGGPGTWGEGSPAPRTTQPRIGIGGIPGIGGRNRGGAGNRGGGTRTGGASSYKGTVRWESAKPILGAMKAPLPEQFAGHYVISVNGFPLLGSQRDDEESSRGSQDDRFDNLKQLTTLQPKGKELAQAGVVHRQVSSGTSFLFGFSKDFLELSADDKEVVFSTHLGQLMVKAKFDLKEMRYHGELAV